MRHVLGDEQEWREVDGLFDAALEIPAEKRSQWLEDACAGNAELRARVEKLLELSERDDDPLRPSGAMTGPVWEDVLDGLDRQPDAQAFEVGAQVGGYEILGLLGRGGMGQVYVASDNKLHRKVALKVLPPELDSTENRTRFEREARAIAALNHPNIVHLYSIEESHGVRFITMELVPGKTLAELIPPDGKWLAGYVQTTAGLRAGIALLSLDTGEYEKLTDFGRNPDWCGDDRKLIFSALSVSTTDLQHNYQQNFKVFAIDRVTKNLREVLSVPGATIQAPAVSRDGKAIYFVLTTVESDIWIVAPKEVLE